jgi:hypothetical protein
MEYEVKYDVYRLEGSHRMAFESSQVCRVVAADPRQAAKYAEKDFNKKYWADKARMMVKKVTKSRTVVMVKHTEVAAK